MEPRLRDYQLIGDNMLFRFAEQILDKPREIRKASVFIGLCISGVKAGDLLEKVKTELDPSTKKIILMVGTNDILQNTDSKLLRKHLHKLVCHLCFKIKVQKLIILTIPPVPRVAEEAHHWKTLKEYNEHIRTFHNGKDIFVIDIYPHFVKNNDSYHNPSPIKPPKPPSSCSTLGRRHIVRTVHLDESDDCQEKENCGRWGGCVSKITTTLMMGRGRSHSSTFYRPNHERKSLEFESRNDSQDNFVDSYLGGSYYEEIDLKYFEECFENKVTRPDNIHLNKEGLFKIGRLILDVIDKKS